MREKLLRDEEIQKREAKEQKSKQERNQRMAALLVRQEARAKSKAD